MRVSFLIEKTGKETGKKKKEFRKEKKSGEKPRKKGGLDGKCEKGIGEKR